MKFLLKVIVFLIWITVKLISMIGNLLTHCACFVFNLLFLCIALGVVMSIAQRLWTTLFILTCCFPCVAGVCLCCNGILGNALGRAEKIYLLISMEAIYGQRAYAAIF